MQRFVQDSLLPLLLKASWQAGVIILFVLALQRVLGWRLSPRWRYWLWLLVVVRLALPWTIPSAVSVFNFKGFSQVAGAVASLRVIPQGHPTLEADSVPDQTSASEHRVSSARAESAPGYAWLTCVWAAGALALALTLMTAQWRLSRRVARRRLVTDSQVLNLLEDCKQQMAVRTPVAVVETPAVRGPCLLGFLRPRLLVPPGFTRGFSVDELRYVFLHELGHVKRHDILFGWLMILLQIAHWFNPLVWLAFGRMRVDRELACDALALTHAEELAKQRYGLTILKLLEGFSDSVRAPGLAGIVEDKKQMKERIDMIAKFQKTKHTPWLAGLFYIGVGLLTLTDAQTGEKTPGTGPTHPSETPQIVSTSPAIGAVDVDPSIPAIEVTFDQDMGGGMSWTGGGLDFPTVPDGQKAHWRDKRTCVLPVKLQVGHYYRVGINSKSYLNFTSARGTPANPTALYFTTQGASDAMKARMRLPHVVAFNPGNGAQDVSPAKTELRVTFSVPMGGGFSWCTAGDDDHDFPKATEGAHPYWTDGKTTCVLPVQLKAGMTYRIKLNDTGANNFQSEGGVPLQSVLYTFKTSDK